MRKIKQILRTAWERLCASVRATFDSWVVATSAAFKAALERLRALCGRSYAAYVVTVPSVVALWTAAVLLGDLFDSLVRAAREIRAIEVRSLSRAHWEKHVRR